MSSIWLASWHRYFRNAHWILWTYGAGNDHSTNWATTTAQHSIHVWLLFQSGCSSSSSNYWATRLISQPVVPWFFFPAFVPLLKSFACPRPLSASSSRSGASTRSRTAVGTPSGRAADPQSGKYNSGNDFCSFKLICCPQSISQSTSLKSAAGKTFKTICDRNLRLCYLTDYKITMTQQS